MSERQDLEEAAERLCFNKGCGGGPKTCSVCASIYCELEEAERRGVERAVRFFLRPVIATINLDAAIELIDSSIACLMKHAEKS